MLYFMIVRTKNPAEVESVVLKALEQYADRPGPDDGSCGQPGRYRNIPRHLAHQMVQKLQPGKIS